MTKLISENPRMKPVPDDMSCSWAWPAWDKPNAQWYQMTMKDTFELDEILGAAATHQEKLDWFAAHPERVEMRRVGNFIHARLVPVDLDAELWEDEQAYWERAGLSNGRP